MPLKAKPIYIIRPDETYYCGPGFVPYYYEDELDSLPTNDQFGILKQSPLARGSSYTNYRTENHLTLIVFKIFGIIPQEVVFYCLKISI